MIRRFSLLSIFILGILLLSLSSPKAQVKPSVEGEMQVDEAIRSADRIEALGFHKDGLLRLESELNRNSSSTKLIMEVAKRCLRGKILDPRRAVELYTIVTALDDQNIEAHLGICDSHLALARHIEFSGEAKDSASFHEALRIARKHANKALKASEGKSARASFLLGELDRRAGLDLVFDADPNAPGLAEKRQRFEADRRAFLESARDHFTRAISVDADDPISKRSLVDTLIELGQFKAARTMLLGLRSVATAEGDSVSFYRRIIHHLESKLALAESPIDLELLKGAWQSEANMSESLHAKLAASIAQRASLQEDKKIGRKFIKVWLEYQGIQWDVEASIQLLAPFVPHQKEGKREWPLVPEFAFLCSAAWEEMSARSNSDEESKMQAEYLERARFVGQAALEIAHEFPEVYGALGHIALRQGEFVEAKKLFTSAIDLIPDNEEYANFARLCDDFDAGRATVADYVALLSLRVRECSNAERLRLLEGLRQRAPEFPDLLGLIGRLYYESGRTEDCVPVFAKALKYRPDEDRWRLMHAMACMRVQNWKDAKSSFVHLNRNKQDPKLANWVTLITKVEKGDLASKALSHYVFSLNTSLEPDNKATLLINATGLNADFAEAYIELAKLFRDQQKFSQAHSYASDAIKHATSEATKSSAAMTMASVHFALHDFDKAALIYRTSLEKMAKSDELRPLILDLLAKCAFFQSKFAEAEVLQAKTIEASLDLRGALPAKYLPQREARSQMPDARIIPRNERFPLGVSLRTSEKIRLKGSYTNIVAGNGDDVEVRRELTINLDILESPSVAEYWKVRVEVIDGPVEDEILNRALVMKISPLFGMESEAWHKKLGEETFEPSKQSLASFALIRNTILELFTCGLGRAELRAPFAWSNMDVAGVLHLKGGSEVSYLAAKSDKKIHLKRIAIGDFRVDADPTKAQLPRQRVDGEILLAFPSRRPIEVDLKMRLSEVLRNDKDVVTDVKNSTTHINLVVESRED